MFGLKDVLRMPAETEDRISLADLIGFDEDLMEQGLNLDADANAGLPPVPADDYICRARFREGVDPTKAWEKKITEKGQTYLATSQVDLEIVSDKEGDTAFQGRKLSPFIMTLLMSGTGTTGVQAFAQGAGADDQFKTLPNHSHKSQALFLNELILSEPLVGVKTDWSVFQKAEESSDGKKFQRRGMDRFPKDDNGNPIPVWIREDGTELNARNDIRSYFMVAEEVQTEAVAEPVKTVPRASVTKQTAPVAAPTPVAASNGAPAPQARRAVPQRRTA